MLGRWVLFFSRLKLFRFWSLLEQLRTLIEQRSISLQFLLLMFLPKIEFRINATYNAEIVSRSVIESIYEYMSVYSIYFLIIRVGELSKIDFSEIISTRANYF